MLQDDSYEGGHSRSSTSLTSTSHRRATYRASNICTGRPMLHRQQLKRVFTLQSVMAVEGGPTLDV